MNTLTFKKIRNDKDKEKKQKLPFKEKVKNFFKIPEEFFQEEPSPQFERKKLFTLTRLNIFLILLVFTVIVNLLVGLDINFLYLRQILGFLFIVSVPGLLIMLCFKIRTVKFWEFLVYTVGLSIAFIMFAGLAVNWTLPALGITNQPLSLYPILICFDIFFIALGIVAWIRNKDFQPYTLTYPKLDALNTIFFTIPICFPILAILGAFLLNNHGPNILTMIMLGAIAVYVLLLVIFRKKLDKNIWPWALWVIGLSLLLMYSMRSWYVFGADISEEYQTFKITLENSFFNPLIGRYNYNAMLSLTIFPTLIQKITSIKSLFVFKLLIQIIFSLSPIIIFLIFRRINNLLSFLASFFFISQTQFFTYFGWARQEIALIFFGLILLTLFSKDINPSLKKIFFLIFGASMIVSHYSTTYIALAIFALTYLAILIYKSIENKKIQKRKIDRSQKTEFYISGAIILILLVFGFLWYSQVTTTSDSLISFISKSFSNLGDMFVEDNKQAGINLFDQINIFYKPPLISPLVKEYQENIQNKYSNDKTLNLYLYKNLNIEITKYDVTSPLNISFSNTLYHFGDSFQKIIRFLFILGIPLLFFYRKKMFPKETFFVIIISLLMFLTIVLIPFSSLSYNMMRLYQQVLVLSSFITLFGGFFLFNILFKKNKFIYFLLIALLIIYFCFSSGLLYRFSGGIDISASIFLQNSGSFYDSQYAHNSELFSSVWLSDNKNNDRVYANPVTIFKIEAFSKINEFIFEDVLPQTIDKKSYVYLDYSNSVLGKGILPYYSLRRITVVYKFPNDFLDDNKNKIYNNGESEIFK